MYSFEEACNIALAELSKLENVRVLQQSEIQALKLRSDLQVWEVTTAVLVKDRCVPLTMLIYLLPDFPYTIPRIFLNEESYDRVKYIPHLDSNRFLCTYDTTITRPDFNNPFAVVYSCLKKAKDIVRDGLEGTNTKDFETEFLAYWNQEYSAKDKVTKNLISVIDTLPSPGVITLMEISNKNYPIRLVLIDPNKPLETFKKNLADLKVATNEIEVFYLGHFNELVVPPFELSNGKVAELLQGTSVELLSSYKRFLKSHAFRAIVVFSKIIKEQVIYFGWIHKSIIANRAGVRNGFFHPFDILSRHQRHELVERLLFENYSPARLSKRSSGVKEITSYKFSIVGIGSVGSHLCQLLNSLNRPSFILIDNDTLEIENLGRHTLGIPSLTTNKAIAMRNYLISHYPHQEVTAYDDSVTDLIRSNPEIFNDSDLIFLAIGKYNVEQIIVNDLKHGIITKPVIIFWVEPFLAGGHFLYLPPGTSDASNFYDSDGRFINNIISTSTYGNHQFALNEAGCQTTYIPYSSTSVISFLSAAFIEVTRVIDLPSKSSFSFTWRGSVPLEQSQNIQFSDLGNNLLPGQTIILRNDPAQ